MPASTTRCQNGSNSGRPNDRLPWKPGTGAGRISTVLAPRSRHHSSSSIAFSTIGSVMTGVAKMRSSKLNVQVSYIHSLSAWITAWVSSGSSFIRSSARLARVGNMRVRSMFSSSSISRRDAGSRNAGIAFIGSPMSSR